MTATNTSVPGTRSAPASPLNGQRSTTCPLRRANGAIRESSENATANPSPPLVQASRPKTAIPASAQ